MTTLMKPSQPTKRKSACTAISIMNVQPAAAAESDDAAKRIKLLSDEGSMQGILSREKKDFSNESELCQQDGPLSMEACMLPNALEGFLHTPQSNRQELSKLQLDYEPRNDLESSSKFDSESRNSRNFLNHQSFDSNRQNAHKPDANLQNIVHNNEQSIEKNSMSSSMVMSTYQQVLAPSHNELPLTVVKSDESELDSLKKNWKKFSSEWTESDDNLLMSLVDKENFLGWENIADKFQTQRTATKCHIRYLLLKNDKDAQMQSYWSTYEDSCLKMIVKEYGARDWTFVCQHLKPRTAKQCRERWFNYLQPTLTRHAWTMEEDNLLVKLHQIHGNKWALISQHFEGRSPNVIKNKARSKNFQILLKSSSRHFSSGSESGHKMSQSFASSKFSLQGPTLKREIKGQSKLRQNIEKAMAQSLIKSRQGKEHSHVLTYEQSAANSSDLQALSSFRKEAMLPQKRSFDSYARQDLSYKQNRNMNDDPQQQRGNRSFKLVATQRFTPVPSMMDSAQNKTLQMSPMCEILSNTDSHESSSFAHSNEEAMIYEMAKKITQSYENKKRDRGLLSKSPSSSYQTCASMPQTCHSPSSQEVRSSFAKKFQKFPEIMSLLKQRTAISTPEDKTKKQSINQNHNESLDSLSSKRNYRPHAKPDDRLSQNDQSLCSVGLKSLLGESKSNQETVFNLSSNGIGRSTLRDNADHQLPSAQQLANLMKLLNA